MKVTMASFGDVRQSEFGIVMMGALVTVDNARIAWAHPVFEFLKNENAILPGMCAQDFWSELQIVNAVVNDRTDLVMYISEAGMKHVDIPRLAIVRLRMPEIKWIEDWLVNSAQDFEHKSTYDRYPGS
jgi:hypothetical protein